MKTIKCASCDNEFYCTTYFNCIRKKYRTLKVLTMMCENMGGWKKYKKRAYEMNKIGGKND